MSDARLTNPRLIPIAELETELRRDEYGHTNNGLKAMVRDDIIELYEEFSSDVLVIDAIEARDLRDWLNKVLP